MNLFAYRTTGLFIRAISEISKAHINLHAPENIPDGSMIFVINHFTRLETFLMPYHIFKLTGAPVWSLASNELFTGALGRYLETVGAVSTKNPERDRLIVKSLLTGEANWIIFPEGRMVKNKKVIEKGRFMISYAGGKYPPHTGAATLAMRTEFYRERLRRLMDTAPEEGRSLQAQFQIEDLEPVLTRDTYIVPVNLTYFPIGARENLLSQLAVRIVEDIPERVMEEIMTEGTMLFSGVDIDIRFGRPISVRESLKDKAIQKDIASPRSIGFDEQLPSRRRMRKKALKIMERYMAAIYAMTSVNSDHLLASMLKAMPSRRFRETALRRKVFLTASLIRQETDVHLHQTLEKDQIHLLTDDRYHSVRDFMAVAVDKKILTEDGDHLIKDPAKFSSPFDFHRARIDNPIEVTANAVEPLLRLQRLIRKIAWQPDFWVRRRIAGLLMRRAYHEFLADYDASYEEGETKAKVVGAPFLIRGKRSGPGVVLVHGYMAGPLEVKTLAEYLGRKGAWVYAPRVKGHGTAPSDLAETSHAQWTESVETGYAIIQCLCKNVFVGGFSNGGGLALELAARVPLDGVFAVSPPLRLKDISSKLVPAVDIWNRLMKRVRWEDARLEFVENHAENPHINYSRNPIAGVRELERFMGSLEPSISTISIPALIVQAQGDPVVNPKGSLRVYQRLGSEDKTYLLVNFQRHGILMGEGSEKIHRYIWEFIQRLV
jgi:esterase/lipase/1-acyl-sn-glycerol-3-phosphate acyltransferase